MAFKTGLISWWALDEASGNALDSHGSNTLTETSGTIGTAAGVVGAARDFEIGDSEWFTIADNAGLSSGDVDFTMGLLVKLESKTTTRRLMGKNGGTTNEYGLSYSGGGDDFSFDVFKLAVATGVHATTFGAPDTGVWYGVMAWHDATANKLYIQVNNGTVDEAAYADGVNDSDSNFSLGDSFNDGAFSHDGLLDEGFFYKRILTSAERTWIWNGGAWRAYSELDAFIPTATTIF